MSIATQEVVFIGDGAAWNEYFPNAVEILDYMHAKSHLYGVANTPSERLEAIGAWINETEPHLYAGNITEVVARI